ncbi:MAG TPA: hypothetical protein VNO86_10505 [Candidatus Binatia bacterium]|nr:hypothetical protein [Candidatus Binatia bacterium]
MSDAITPHAFFEAEGPADWRIVGDGATAFFPTADAYRNEVDVATVAGR